MSPEIQVKHIRYYQDTRLLCCPPLILVIALNMHQIVNWSLAVFTLEDEQIVWTEELSDGLVD